MTVAMKVADGQGADLIRNSVIALHYPPSKKLRILSVYGEAESGKRSDQLRLATALSITLSPSGGTLVFAKLDRLNATRLRTETQHGVGSLGIQCMSTVVDFPETMPLSLAIIHPDQV